MRLLILCARFPEYGHKGDQLRARQLLELLAPDHDLHVVSGGRPSGAAALQEARELARVTVIEPGVLARIGSGLASVARGVPAEVGWMSPRRLRQTAAGAAADSDAVIASTVRAVTGPLPVPLIVDHIDALSANLRERATVEPHQLLRLALGVEARLLARHERRVAAWAAAQVVVSGRDALMLPTEPAATVIPHVVFQTTAASEVDGSQSTARDIDVILTGNMRYPPNRDAANWLADAIAPEIRRLRPQTRVVVAGRGSAELGLSGIELIGEVPDLSALIRRARVAIVPLRAGTGVPNKLLEAAAAGAAIVATPRAAASAGVAAISADTATELGGAVVALLDDEPARAALATRALVDLGVRSPSVVAAALRQLLVTACASRDATGPKIG